jgi:murein DD-endopeptidase MepM/ murein hydrolase activator NlpD
MADRKWTLLLLADEPDSIRQFSVSRAQLRRVTTGAGVLAALVLTVSGFLLVSGSAHLRARNLARENDLLTEELREFQLRVNELEGTISHLGDEDGKIRLLAGLGATDEEILEVGIGGPGLSTPEAHPLWRLDSVSSKAAFAVDYDLNALERRARLLTESLAEASDSLQAHWDLLEATPSILPAAGVLSSNFSNSRFHPIHHRNLPHEGVDISAARGTPILAAAKGTVTFSGWMTGYGNTVQIDHGHGYVTLYGHADKILVRRGQVVRRGDVVGQVGSTGIATSTHLHYEIRIGGKAVNPLNYVIGRVLP